MFFVICAEMAGCKLSVLVATLATTYVVYVSGHGMMMEPPNRSSMWRFHPDSPPNYNDNENFCGGFGVQWMINNGSCGLCGDDSRLPRPRPNENGGTWGLGKLSRTYTPGEVIPVHILITANHWGTFHYSLCRLNDPSTYEPENCFQPLQLGDGSEFYQIPGMEKGYYNMTVQLPQERCERCVLRWWWRTANTWGPCGDGTSDVGCGPQETFVSCSDISIV